MKKYSWCLLLVPFLMSSCLVFDSGNVSGGPLLNAKDTYVDIAMGKCKIHNWTSGKHNKNMVLRAKADMYRNRPLKPGEYYSNFSIDFTSMFFIVVLSRRVVVSAEVLMTADTITAPFSKNFKKLLTRDSLSKQLRTQPPPIYASSGNGKDLAASDTVYYSGDHKHYVIYKVSSIDKENVMLLATQPADENMLVGMQNLFFKRKGESNGFKIGDKVIAELPNGSNSAVSEEVVIMGLAGDNILVKTKSGLQAVSVFKCMKVY